MAKKAAPKGPVSREGKRYQLKKSAMRAAKEDGLKPGQFEVRESVRGDGFYYMQTNREGVAEELLADCTPEELEEIKQIDDKELKKIEEEESKAFDQGVQSASDGEHLPNETIIEKLKHAEQTKPKENPAPPKEEPPPLPSEIAQETKQRGPRTRIPVTHRSTIESPTKLVWHIADELVAKNPNTTRKQVIEECVRRGIAFFTARTQYQQWYTAQRESRR